MHATTLAPKPVFLVLGLCLSMMLLGCGKGFTGKYVSEKDAKVYLEFKADGTFILFLGGVGKHGKYAVDGNDCGAPLALDQ
jgi:hypothetical protein